MPIREDRALLRENRTQQRIKHFLRCVPCRLRREGIDLTAPNVRLLAASELSELLGKIGGFTLHDEEVPPNGRH